MPPASSESGAKYHMDEVRRCVGRYSIHVRTNLGEAPVNGCQNSFEKGKNNQSEGISRDMVDETNNHQDVYSIQTVDLKVQVWDTSRGISQIVWTQSAKLEQTKENK